MHVDVDAIARELDTARRGSTPVQPLDDGVEGSAFDPALAGHVVLSGGLTAPLDLVPDAIVEAVIEGDDGDELQAA